MARTTRSYVALPSLKLRSSSDRCSSPTRGGNCPELSTSAADGRCCGSGDRRALMRAACAGNVATKLGGSVRLARSSVSTATRSMAVPKRRSISNAITPTE